MAYYRWPRNKPPGSNTATGRWSVNQDQAGGSSHYGRESLHACTSTELLMVNVGQCWCLTGTFAFCLQIGQRAKENSHAPCKTLHRTTTPHFRPKKSSPTQNPHFRLASVAHIEDA
jgi:hypothetical protein